ncbi:Rossmann-fold NAD(P)-binding domain-containing protein [Vallitalea okinawensis]|uniref:NAD(P)-dependent oxidoreductase n=1 Tax=Vallitalea okinawensis TaxID=2078660 RepID=UPI000CFB1D04|nr:NAD(P)-dependent oxidoreductase [Vallitalea okinawensis]
MKILVIGLQNSLSLEIVTTLKKQHHVIGFANPSVANNNKIYKQLGIDIINGDLRSYEDVSKALEGIETIIYIEALPSNLSCLNNKLSKAVYMEGTSCLLKAIREQENQVKLIFFSSPHPGKEIAEEMIRKLTKTPWVTIKVEYELERSYKFRIIKKALVVKVLANLASELSQETISDLWGDTYFIHINKIIRALQDELIEDFFNRYGKDMTKILKHKRRVHLEKNKLDQYFNYRKSVVDELGEKIVKSLPRRLELLRFFPYFILRKIYMKRIEDDETMVRYLQQHKYLEVQKK